VHYRGTFRKDKLVVTLWGLNQTNWEQLIRMLQFSCTKDSYVHEAFAEQAVDMHVGGWRIVHDLGPSSSTLLQSASKFAQSFLLGGRTELVVTEAPHSISANFHRLPFFDNSFG
jgi:hypothetical protein